MAQYSVDIQLSGTESLRQSEINSIIRKALELMVLRWRRKYLPLHFTKAGARKYGFKPRSGELNPLKKGTYSYYKLRNPLIGHILPNVYTGELRRLAVHGPQTVKATVTSTRATARAVLPRKANFRLHELKLTTDAELADLANYLVLQIESRLSGGRASASIREQRPAGLLAAA